eukprot:4715899-Pleurochrysis_carterae.AAC.1
MNKTRHASLRVATSASAGRDRQRRGGPNARIGRSLSASDASTLRVNGYDSDAAGGYPPMTPMEVFLSPIDYRIGPREDFDHR